jgi:hypothetical protein
MPFKFKDLIITLLPETFHHGSAMSCGGTCDAGSQETVGSCTSECGGIKPCGMSDELIDPLSKLIDPQYMSELRLLLRHAVQKARIERMSALETQMVPQTLQEAELVEQRLKEALAEVASLKGQLAKGDSQGR